MGLILGLLLTHEFDKALLYFGHGLIICVLLLLLFEFLEDLVELHHLVHACRRQVLLLRKD